MESHCSKKNVKREINISLIKNNLTFKIMKFIKLFYENIKIVLILFNENLINY